MAYNKLVTDDLARSGLLKPDITLLKIKYLSPSATKILTKKSVDSYQIPYFNSHGKVTSFSRVRFLGDPTKFGKAKKPQRYWQPPGSEVGVYLPPYIAWTKVYKDIEETIYIVEGEKKSATACKAGYNCIGLGGVWSFYDKDHNVTSELQSINWEQRETIIAFDSDLSTNPKVAQAMHRLSRELTDLGAIVYQLYLPDAADGSKQGVDDLIVAEGEDSLENLSPESYNLSRELWRVNDEICVINELACAYDIEYKRALSDAQVNFKYENKSIIQHTSEDKVTKISLSKAWRKWPLRRNHEKLVYKPGKPKITESNELNLWEGWGVTPVEGSIRPWEELMLEYLFAGNEDFYHWFMQWIAYPIQHPGAKLATAVLLCGTQQGTGKSFTAHIIAKLYGHHNYEKLSNHLLHSSFNGWIKGKQFIIGEEVMGSDKRNEMDTLKDMITSEWITVNEKHQPTYLLQNCANFFLNSNHLNALYLEETDRRFAVYETPRKVAPDSLFAKLRKWYESTDLENSPAALFHHLLHEVDVSNFNYAGPAPASLAKSSMQELSTSDLQYFANQLRDNVSHCLKWKDLQIDRKTFTAKDLLELCRIQGYDNNNKVTSTGMSRVLRIAGFEYRRITTQSKGQIQLYAIRNREWMEDQDNQEWANDYDQSLIFSASKKGSKFKNKRLQLVPDNPDTSK